VCAREIGSRPILAGSGSGRSHSHDYVWCSAQLHCTNETNCLIVANAAAQLCWTAASWTFPP
jgi:hypothetical protein